MWLLCFLASPTQFAEGTFLYGIPSWQNIRNGTEHGFLIPWVQLALEQTKSQGPEVCLCLLSNAGCRQNIKLCKNMQDQGLAIKFSVSCNIPCSLLHSFSVNLLILLVQRNSFNWETRENSSHSLHSLQRYLYSQRYVLFPDWLLPHFEVHSLTTTGFHLVMTMKASFGSTF